MKGKRIVRARRQRRAIDNKIRKECKACGKKLPKNSKHHARCHACWIKHQESRGNAALIGGIR